MKRVTLLGDSIRMGYEPTVRAELAGRAEIWAPEGNCMHSVHHVFNPNWYLEQPADVIHVNFGLWDARRMGRDCPENTVPVDLFVRNLDFLLGRVRAATDAVVIWATCTPVVAERYNANAMVAKTYGFYREDTDGPRYNAAAAPVLEKYGVLVNDLFAFVEELGTERLICDDGVHFTDEGSVILGRKVAAEIRKHL